MKTDILKQNIEKLLNSVDLNDSTLSPSEWIEKNRYVQEYVSSNLRGMYKFYNAPYMREIVDHLSPYSPVHHIALMKGVRLGATFSLVHCGVPYIISERPENIMLVSATDDLVKETMEGVDHGIDGCKIRHLLGKGSDIQTNSKGDTANAKYFHGGFKLFNIGGQSETQARQKTAGIILFDEPDAAKSVTKAGSIASIIEDRAKTLGVDKKIVYLSSPLLLKTSLIYKKYLLGDQRKYLVPCPNCGNYIELLWNEKNKNGTRYGVLFDIKFGEVVENSVRYRCGICENDFQENKYKMDILDAGYWNPTVDRLDKHYLSYHISALYANVVFDGWYAFAKQYQEAYPRGGMFDDSELQAFTNSILGLPFEPKGIEVKVNKLQDNRRDYEIGECPFELSKKDGNGEIMLITIACDLNGWMDNPIIGDDVRLDYEIKAHSEKGATYSIDAGSVGTFIPEIEKRTLQKEGVDVAKLEQERIKYTYRHGVDNSVWPEFFKICNKRFGKYERRVNLVVIDTGNYTDYAYEATRKLKKQGIVALGLKGKGIDEKWTNQMKAEKGRIYELMTNGEFYLIDVNIVKDWLPKFLNAGSYLDDYGNINQDINFMNFPHRNPDSSKYTYRNYFAHYEAEAKMLDKKEGQEPRYYWKKKKPNIQNHFLDVWVYNTFARIFLQEWICSNQNPYKVKYYKSQKIEATWANACRLIKEASFENNLPLS